MSYVAVASMAFQAPHATSASTAAVTTSPDRSTTAALSPVTSITPQAMIATDPRMNVMGATVHG